MASSGDDIHNQHTNHHARLSAGLGTGVTAGSIGSVSPLSSNNTSSTNANNINASNSTNNNTATMVQSSVWSNRRVRSPSVLQRLQQLVFGEADKASTSASNSSTSTLGVSTMPLPIADELHDVSPELVRATIQRLRADLFTVEQRALVLDDLVDFLMQYRYD
jgi:hypothetical protein